MKKITADMLEQAGLAIGTGIKGSSAKGSSPTKAAADSDRVAEVAELLDRYIEVEHQLGGDDFWDTAKGFWDDHWTSDRDWMSQRVWESLKTNRRLKDEVFYAQRDGVPPDTIIEMAVDLAAVHGERDCYITLDKLESGEQSRPISDLDDEIVEASEGFDDADWKAVDLRMRSGGRIDVPERELRWDLGITAYFGLDAGNYDRFISRLDEAHDDMASQVAQSEERGPETDTIVYRVQHPKFSGYYVADLPATALGDEGSQQRICVGDPKMGYIGQVKKGALKIYSLRSPAGKTLLTFEVDPSRFPTCEQIKGKANRLPGYDNAGGTKSFIKPAEVEVASEILEWLRIDPNGCKDLKPGLRALSEGVEQPQQASADAEWHCGFCRRPHMNAKAAVLEQAAALLDKRN